MINNSRLRELLHYDPDTGIFTRKTSRGGCKVNSHVGTANADGYLMVELDFRTYSLHRLAWFYVTNRWPENEIDHINGDRADNRLVNLREATHLQNSRNQGLRKSNKSGVKGVSWEGRRSKWRASAMVSGKKIHLGYFDDKCLAETAVRSFRSANDGEFQNHG